MHNAHPIERQSSMARSRLFTSARLTFTLAASSLSSPAARRAILSARSMSCQSWILRAFAEAAFRASCAIARADQQSMWRGGRAEGCAGGGPSPDPYRRKRRRGFIHLRRMTKASAWYARPSLSSIVPVGRMRRACTSFMRIRKVRCARSNVEITFWSTHVFRIQFSGDSIPAAASISTPGSVHVSR